MDPLNPYELSSNVTSLRSNLTSKDLMTNQAGQSTAFQPQLGEQGFFGIKDLSMDQKMANSMKLSPEEFGKWKSENALNYKNKALGEKYNAEAANLNATPWTDYASAGAAGLGALTGVASYFDNKDMNKKRAEAMDVNIGIAKEEQQHRRDFRSNTKSAFA